MTDDGVEDAGEVLAPRAPGIAELAAALAALLAEFAASLDEAARVVSMDRLAKMLDVYSRALGRLARIQRLEQAMKGGSSDELQKAIDWALDQLAEDWEVVL